MNSPQQPALEAIHVWYHCHHCGMRPLSGLRFECQTCPAGPDNDLCEACHQGYEEGRVPHPKPDSLGAMQPRKEHRFVSYPGVPAERFTAWLEVPRAQAPAPDVPDHFVVRPEFCEARSSSFGSYGFVIEADGAARPLVLTALHVMDEFIKKAGVDCGPANAAYTGQELPPLLKKVRLYDVFAPRWPLAEVGTADTMLALPGARVGDEEPYSGRDIAAFRVAPGARVVPGRLAARSPAVGEPVWLSFNLGPGTAGRLVEAVVVESTDRTLVYRFAPGSVEGLHSSGAPLLNRAGDVVGINVGGGFLSGHRLGHANHVESIRQHLDGLVKKAPA